MQGRRRSKGAAGLGFSGIEHVRIGRIVELEADSTDQLEEEKLLANPLIEDYEIETVSG